MESDKDQNKEKKGLLGSKLSNRGKEFKPKLSSTSKT